MGTGLWKLSVGLNRVGKIAGTCCWMFRYRSTPAAMIATQAQHTRTAPIAMMILVTFEDELLFDSIQINSYDNECAIITVLHKYWVRKKAGNYRDLDDLERSQPPLANFNHWIVSMCCFGQNSSSIDDAMAQGCPNVPA